MTLKLPTEATISQKITGRTSKDVSGELTMRQTISLTCRILIAGLSGRPMRNASYMKGPVQRGKQHSAGTSLTATQPRQKEIQGIFLPFKAPPAKTWRVRGVKAQSSTYFLEKEFPLE